MVRRSIGEAATSAFGGIALGAGFSLAWAAGRVGPALAWLRLGAKAEPGSAVVLRSALANLILLLLALAAALRLQRKFSATPGTS
jgi:hypothetical protein